MSQEIGKKIKHLRRSKRMTQEDLAQKLGNNISRSTISNYEIGRRTPHLKELQRFASVFGVGLDYFGVEMKDEVFDVIARAKEVFESPEVEKETKEKLYMEFMRFYLEMKGNENE